MSLSTECPPQHYYLLDTLEFKIYQELQNIINSLLQFWNNSGVQYSNNHEDMIRFTRYDCKINVLQMTTTSTWSKVKKDQDIPLLFYQQQFVSAAVLFKIWLVWISRRRCRVTLRPRPSSLSACNRPRQDINTLTWLRGFQVKPLYLVLLFCI